MNADTQALYMQSNAKKILLLFLMSFAFIAFSYFGANHLEKQLASFSGVITALVRINPLDVEAIAPFEAQLNKVFKVDAILINKGEEQIKNAKGEIFLPLGLTLVKKNSVQGAGVIPAGKEKKVSWSVKGEQVGNYIIIVSASGELKGQEIFAEDSIRIEIKESLKGARPSAWFQNFINLFEKWLRP